jgi:hypothetical protein
MTKKRLNQQLDQTVAGLSKNTLTADGQKTSKQPVEHDVIEAINQMFAELELVYHNQYNKAFNSPEKLHYAKKLWYSNLRGYSSDTILAAVKRATKESEFLPSVRSILKYCETSLTELGLPSPRAAYREACNAPSPKQTYNWSHPAVYFAGHASDWFFLANNPEYVTFKVFESNYQNFCQQVSSGETLIVPVPTMIEQQPAEPLERADQKKHMQEMRKGLGI